MGFYQLLKNLRSLALIILASPLLASCNSSFTLVSGLLGQTNGSSTKSGVFAVGVNLSGLEEGSTVPGVAGTDYQVPTQTELQYYKSRGMLKLRVPILWERLQPSLNGALDTTYLGYITTLLDQAGGLGMTLILDMHNYAQRTEGAIGSVAVPTTSYLDVWTKLADAVKNNSGLAGYDLMNEPVNIAASDWKNIAQLAITAIRSIDMNHTIYVMGGGWGGAWNFVDTNPTLNQISDPANNLIFEAHVYFDRDSSGTHYTWADEVAAGSSAPSGIAIDTSIGVNRISSFVGWLQANGFRGQIGEVGVGRDNQDWLIALDTMLAYAQSNNIEVQYWAGGPGWGTSFPYSTEFASDVNLQASQMAVLSKYTGATQPNSFILTGPSRGSVGVPSTNFTLLYRGYISSTLTFTPSDGGAGGTFAPASIDLSPGFNGTATFTYTPASTATFTITASGTGGLTPLSPVGYATQTDSFIATASSAQNIYSLRRAYAPYVGPLIRLRRSDGTQNDFSALSNGSLDTASIVTWAAGSALTVVKWYDQSPNGNHMGPVFDQDSAASTTADYPTFIVSDTDGYPSIQFTGTSRMDASSPLTAISNQSLLIVASHSSGSRLISAMHNAVEAWPADYGSGWEFYDGGSTDESISIGLDTGSWRAYESSWQGGVASGWNTYKNGASVASATSSQSTWTLEYNRNVFNFGYKAYDSSVSWQGKVREISILSNALTSGNVTTFDTDMRSAWGL